MLPEQTTSITTAEHSVPPWEQPGCFRMDCEPHRAGFLRAMGTGCIATGLLSIIVPFLLGLVGVPLCLATWLMARSDLAKMQKGLMDPGGEWNTKLAGSAGLTGLGLHVASAVGWCVFLYLARMLP